MVKVKNFCGAVFLPQEYQFYLKNNIQHLESTPMSKTFQTTQMLASGKLKQQNESFFYIYGQHYLGHVSFGILAEISIEDYHNSNIKKNQKTLVRPGLNQETYLKQHVGAVVVSHRKDQAINEMIMNLTKSKEKFSQWTTSDGREHALWRVKASQVAISQKFNQISCLYILDGHHRLQAAFKNYLSKTIKTEVDSWIQAIIYSSSYVVIHPQHRAIQSTPENISAIEGLINIKSIQLTELSNLELNSFDLTSELCNYEVILKYYQRFYGITFKNSPRNVLSKISTYRLQNQIFKQCFQDQELKKLKYVPGIIKRQLIFKQDIVFFVQQPAVETIFEVADAEVTMPPRSTWVEPKPCSHMVIRLLN